MSERENTYTRLRKNARTSFRSRVGTTVLVVGGLVAGSEIITANDYFINAPSQITERAIEHAQQDHQNMQQSVDQAKQQELYTLRFIPPNQAATDLFFATSSAIIPLLIGGLIIRRAWRNLKQDLQRVDAQEEHREFDV